MHDRIQHILYRVGLNPSRPYQLYACVCVCVCVRAPVSPSTPPRIELGTYWLGFKPLGPWRGSET